MASSYAALTWDGTGQKYYHTGTDMGALFVIDPTTGNYGDGIAWNGLTSVQDNPQGGDRTELWADNIMYATMSARETSGGSISCYTYPPEFEECLGRKALATGVYIGQQTRKKFGFAYRTLVGNDVTEKAGEIIHLYYGCSASPSSQDHQTINDNPDAVEFSFDFEATPVAVDSDNGPTATLDIDSRAINNDTKWTAIKNLIFGSTSANAKMPTPNEIKAIVIANS